MQTADTVVDLSSLLRDALAAHPDKVAVRTSREELTYGALAAEVVAVAKAVAATGIRSGDRVGLVIENDVSFPVAFYACQYLGCIAVPLGIQLPSEALRKHLDDCEATTVLTTPSHEARVQLANQGSARTTFVVTGTRGGAPPDVLPPTGRPADSTAVILYTSGTTGQPKGAELTHANLLANVRAIVRALELSSADEALAVLPLCHVFGLTYVMNAIFAVGGTLRIHASFSGEAVLSGIVGGGVTYFAGVPTMFIDLLSGLESSGLDVTRSSLRVAVCGGASLPTKVAGDFETKFDVEIREGYGLTETSPAAALNPKGHVRRGSVGMPLEGVQFRLTADDGTVIDKAEVRGEIEICGPNVMRGYYKNPQATADVLNGGWFSTGDIGQRDCDGYYYIVDRKKDLIISGGYNIAPREVEEILYRYPGVKLAAVVGLPSERLGQEVVAVIVTEPGAEVSGDALDQLVGTHVARYKRPRRYIFRDSLPTGPTGKILKRELVGDPDLRAAQQG